METPEQRTLDLVVALSGQVERLAETQDRMVDAIGVLADRVHSTRMALADTMKALTIAAKHVPMDDDNYQKVMDSILSAASFFDTKKND